MRIIYTIEEAQKELQTQANERLNHATVQIESPVQLTPCCRLDINVMLKIVRETPGFNTSCKFAAIRALREYYRNCGYQPIGLAEAKEFIESNLNKP